jgi:hypothetical protein
MKKRFTKSSLIFGFVSGFLFACMIAGFDYYNDDPFNFTKFIFQFLLFGLFQSLIIHPLAEK